jgi:DNA-binding winged helix-turn-helix (wHTH) protein/TolB-like protein/Tfp pilus assembly protein PilF
MKMSSEQRGLYDFGRFRLDLKERLLLCDGQPLTLPPKVFDTLATLVRHHGHLVEKEQLMKEVWPDTFVEEVNLAVNISMLRKALGESGNGRTYIETVPKRGYRFTPHVHELNDGDDLAIDKRANARAVTEEPESAGDIKTGKEVPANALQSPRTSIISILQGWIKRNPTRSRTFKLAAVTAVIILSVGPAAALFRSKKPLPTPASLLATIAVMPSTPSVPEDRDPAAEFGLAAALINRLSGVRSLVVRPAASVVKYTSLEPDPIAAGHEQQVNYVLASGYRKLGEKYVLAAKLIRVRDGSVLWSDSCEEQCDTFAWQDALAEKTVQSLLRALTDDHRRTLTKHGTENQKAFDFFNLGLYAWYQNNYDIEGLKKSAQYFEQAIALDPNYAEAYAWLATTNERLGLTGGADRKDYEPRAEDFARKALALDDTVFQAHLVLGVSAYSYYWDWARAEEHFKLARALNPDNAEVARTYAAYLASLGRLDESVFWQQRACDLQPLSFDLNAVLVMRFFIARRYDEAIQEARKALQMRRATPTLYFVWRSYEQQHMYEEAHRALQELLAEEKDTATAALISRTYAASGYEKARNIYLKKRLTDSEQRAKQQQFNPVDAAIMCALLGNRDKAFEWLEEGFKNHSFGLIYLKVNPEFDSLRSDPRYTDLLRRVHLGT